ncbi:hypothetical protein MAC_08559 [Metarhizium acridum CQMa 102]|uniref:Uncharacterized protein n=1 Tax=Metarhizium acridum (strain CQMa 102) TaxID=655827 RepID=E9EFB1_METAQ|nr:uncharacterized protein MAC_08559 [Metarhizium acridum CQMa 102]EFY85427.1 hypothetical protein MAC_08559 [Metarhizium acridum CQMa 102]
MDVVIKILVGIVFVYTWDYMAPYLTRSDSTARRFLERAVVRLFSWTEMYLTKVMTTFRQQFYQDLHDLSHAVGIPVPKSESRPDVSSAGSKSQPLNVPIRQTSSYQPSHRGVDESIALSRLEECTNGSQYRRPVAACYESQAATPVAYTQNNNSRFLPKCERSKTCPRERQRLEKPQQMEAPEYNGDDQFRLQKHHQSTTELQNLANSSKQLETAANETNILFRQAWENLDQLLPPRQRGGQSRQKFLQKMLRSETDFRQEGMRLESVLHRMKGKQFHNKESLALEQEKFANDLNYYENTLNRFRKWLRDIYSENKSHHENLRKKPRQEDLQKKRLQEVVEKKLEQGLQNKPRQENLRKKPLQENLHNKPRQKPLHDKPCREGSQKKPLQELVEKKIQEFSQNQRRRVDLRKKLLHENLRKELPRLEYFQSKPHQELW